MGKIRLVGDVRDFAEQQHLTLVVRRQVRGVGRHLRDVEMTRRALHQLLEERAIVGVPVADLGPRDNISLDPADAVNFPPHALRLHPVFVAVVPVAAL